MTLTLKRHPKIAGVWLVRHGNKILAALVQSNLDIQLGIIPTAKDAIRAARELKPDYGDITDATLVRIVDAQP